MTGLHMSRTFFLNGLIGESASGYSRTETLSVVNLSDGTVIKHLHQFLCFLLSGSHFLVVGQNQ